ncbi:hypothetical protein [Mesorhizobium sp. ORM16]|uniref:hypothetical protein n=1 Tax=Mesorhizobium sp. ORM16 TaxID=3376989 RepID=UPI00385786D5
MRWRHPTLGTISPSQFIPIAEKRVWERRLSCQIHALSFPQRRCPRIGWRLAWPSFCRHHPFGHHRPRPRCA